MNNEKELIKYIHIFLFLPLLLNRIIFVFFLNKILLKEIFFPYKLNENMNELNE